MSKTTGQDSTSEQQTITVAQKSTLKSQTNTVNKSICAEKRVIIEKDCALVSN